MYSALSIRCLAVVEGRIFMVDYHGGRLLTFDGDRARQIAGKGKGPGELQRPSWITVRDGQLHIKDFQKIQIFDARGQFIKSIRLLAGFDYVGRLEDGMLFLSGLGYGQLENPLELALQSMETGERTTLASWAPELERNPRAERTDFKQTKMALEHTHAWMSYDGKVAFVQVAGLNEVHIIDLEQRQTLEVIEVTGKPVPFDKEEGREYLEAFNKKHGSNMKGDYPDFYPLIERIVVTRENHLIIIKSTGRSTEDNNSALNPDNYLFYNRVGNPITPNILDLNFWRVAWLEEDRVYVNIYNEALDEFTVVRCVRDDFEAVIAKYPLMARGL